MATSSNSHIANGNELREVHSVASRMRKAVSRLMVAAAALVAVGASAQTSYTWNSDAAANWNDTTRWLPNTGFPTGVDVTANLLFNITADRTITLNVPITLGTMNVNDTSGGSIYTIAGSGANTLTWDVSSGTAKLNIGNGTATGGNVNISAGMVINDRLDITLNDTDHRTTLNLTGSITGGVAPGQVAIYITNPTSVQTGIGMKWNEVVFNTGTNTYTGQLLVDSGAVRYEGGTPAGAYGVGNETVITGSGRVDLNGQTFMNAGANTAEIFVLNGHGYNNMGALVNRNGTALINRINLTGDSSVYVSTDQRIDMRSSGTLTSVLDMDGRSLNKFGGGTFVLMNTQINNVGTFNIYEGMLRLETNPGLSGGEVPTTGLTINLDYDPRAWDGSNPANGTRTSNDLYTTFGNLGVSDTVGNSVREARLEFWQQNLTHTGMTINMSRGAIERSGATTTGISFNTILDATSRINLVEGGVRDNFFRISGGSSAFNATTLKYDDPGALIVRGEINNTAPGNAGTGITKTGNRELRLENANANFNGTFFVKGNPGRYLPTGFRRTGETGVGEMETQYASLTLSGATGGLISAANVEVGDNATLWLDNRGANQNNRLNNSGNLNLIDGFVLLTTHATDVNQENFGNVNSVVGTNKLFIDTRNSARADIALQSLNISEGSVFKIAFTDHTDTWGTGATDNRIQVVNPGSVQMSGNVVVGAFGSIAPGGTGAGGQSASTLARPLDALLNGQARSNVSARLMTLENVGGTYYLRPLLASEYSATPTANSNWMVTSSVGTFGTKGNAVNVASDTTINSLTIADTANDNVNGEYVHIQTGSTLTINSGMINFANYTQNTTANTEATIQGGQISMNGRQAIINSGNFWEDLDTQNDGSGNLSYYAYIAGNNAFMRSSIVNADGLVKTGRNNLYLDTSNQFTAGSIVYAGDESSLVARHSQALNGATEVVISGSANFLLQGGVNITGVDVRADTLTADGRYLLRSEGSHNTWGGDVIIDTLDSMGSHDTRRHRIAALNNATLSLYGDIYTVNNSQATASDVWMDPYIISTESGQSGVINLRGRVRDTETGPLGLPVNARGDTATTIDRNHALRFQHTGSEEGILNAFQQWEATGRLEVRQGYFRIMYDPATAAGSGGFLTDDTRSRILANDYFTRLTLGADGTSTTNNYHSHLSLTQAGQVLNYPFLYVQNDNRQGTQTIMGENRSGSVYLGSLGNNVDFSLQFANQGADRDLRFLQLRGGTMVFNGRLNDEGTSVNSSVSIVGPGNVVFNANNAGVSNVERWNLLGGNATWNRGAFNNDNQFATSAAVSMWGGGSLTLTGGGSARTQNMSGNIHLLAGSSSMQVDASNTLTLGSATATLNRRNGSSVVLAENGGSINLSYTGSPATAGQRFGSWAIYGTAHNNVTHWAAREGATGVQAFTGYTNDSFAGVHTNLVTAGPHVSGNASTASVRFEVPASIDIGGAGNTLTVTDGGILIPTAVSGPVAINNGSLTSSAVVGSTRDLIMHNYGSGTATIGAAISNDGANKVNFVHNGSGTTVLSGDNTYTGDTYLNGGVVSITSDDNLGDVSGSINRLVFYSGGSGYTNSQTGVALTFGTAGGVGTAATGTFNTNTSAAVSAITLTQGGSGYQSGVYVSAVAAGNNAGIWAIMDSGNLRFDGGTLRVNNDVTLNGARTLFLGANGGTLSVADGSVLTVNGFITTEASDVSTANGYGINHDATATNRYTDRNPDLGDLTISGGGTVALMGNPDNTTVARANLGMDIGGMIWINEGALRIGLAGSSANSWFGTNRSFTDSTVIGPNGTLELAAASDADIFEWFTFEGKGYRSGGTVRTIGTARTYDFNGQLDVKDDVFLNLRNGSNLYIGESGGGNIFGSGDIIRNGTGRFEIRMNAIDWQGDLVLGSGANYLYGAAKLPNVNSIKLSRNAYLEFGFGSTANNEFDNRVKDTASITSAGNTRLRIGASGGVFSGIERLGKYHAALGVAGIEIDLGADVLAGQARLTDDYAGVRFSEITRDTQSVGMFRNLDAGSSFAGSQFGAGNTPNVINKAVFQVDTAPTLVGGGTGTNGDRGVITGFFGGTRENWFSTTTNSRMTESYTSRHFMTVESGIDPVTGNSVNYLRPLSDAAGSSDYKKFASGSQFNLGSNIVGDATSSTILDLSQVNANQNLRFIGLEGDSLTGTRLGARRDSFALIGDSTNSCEITLGGNLTVNTLSIALDVYGNGTNGWGETFNLMMNSKDKITVNSGMILSANLGVQNRGGTAGNDANANLDMRNSIHGGTLDMNGQQAIIVNQSRWVQYNTTGQPNAYEADDGDNTQFSITSNISNTGGKGLLKAGGASVMLDGVNSYTGDTTVAEGLLYVRHQGALGQSERMNVVGGGGLVIGYGARIEGVDAYIGAMTGSNWGLLGEQDGASWGGNVIIDNVDYSGTAGGYNRGFVTRISNSGAYIFSIDGDIYGGAFDANSAAINNGLGTEARIFNTRNNSNNTGGLLDLRGRVRDTATGAISGPITDVNQNQMLRMEVVSQGNNENTVQIWNQYDAAGRIRLINGYLRYAGEGNFYTNAAAAAINPNNEMSGFQMGGRSLISDDGVTATTSNLTFMLGNAGNVFNLSSWEVGVDTTDASAAAANLSYGRGNTTGNSTIGGENRTGQVTFGTGMGTVKFTQTSNLTAAYDRDLRLYAARGGEVNMRTNFVDGGNLVNSSLTKIGSGNVNLLGSTAGASTVERLNVLGGTLRFTGYNTNLNRRVGNGASLYFGGGSLVMNGTNASFTENFGNFEIVRGGSSLNAQGNGAGLAGVISISDTTITRATGGVVNFQTGGGGRIALTGSTNTARLGSWATFGSGLGETKVATDWAATDASGNVIAFNGYSATLAAGNHTNVTGANAAGTTSSLRFNTAGGEINSGTALTVQDGGVLFTNNYTGGVAIGAGISVTSGGATDLVFHNYASQKVTIAGNITGTQLVQFNGTGTTTLMGTNTYTGKTYITGGSTVEIDAWERLGAAPSAVDQLYLSEGVLRYTGTGASTADTRNITLGGGDGAINVSNAAGRFIHRGIIASEAANVIGTYGSSNPNNGGLFITGPGVFQMGIRNFTAQTTTDVAGLNHTYTGITVIGDGVTATKVELQGNVNDSAFISPFGTTESWADATILRNNSTLEISPMRGGSGYTGEVRLREWFQWGENANDNVTLTVGTQRGVVMNGMQNVVGNLFINTDALNYADTNAPTASGSINFGLNDEGGLYGTGKVVMNGNGTVSFRSSMPNFTGQFDLQDGFMTTYSNSKSLGSGTSPFIIGLNGETDQVRLFFQGEHMNNGVTTGWASVATDITVSHDILVRNTSQDVRIGGGYYGLNGTVRFTGKIQMGGTGPLTDYLGQASNGAAPNVRLYYEDTEGLDASLFGVGQEMVFDYTGGFYGTGNLLIDVNEGGSANDTPHDIVGIFNFAADNSAWNGFLQIGADAGTVLDTDDLQIVRLSHANAIGSNNVRFLNNSKLQLGGMDRLFNGNDFTFAGGTGLSSSAKIENGSTTTATATFSSIGAGQTAQEVDVGLSDGVGATVVGGGKAALNVRKTGSGDTVFGVSNSGTEPGSFSNYTGTTSIEQGSLSAGGNFVLSPNSRFIINSGAELRLYYDEFDDGDGIGRDNTIGSLVGVSGALVNIDNSSILRVGGDNTRDAVYSGMVTGSGNFYKVGTGAQKLSGTNTFEGTVAILNGALIGASNSAFGDTFNQIYLGGSSLAEGPVDARVELLLSGTATAVQQGVTMDSSVNSNGDTLEGISVIGTRETSGTYGFDNNAKSLSGFGGVDIYRDLFVVSEGTSTVQFKGAFVDLSGDFSSSLTKIGSGTVQLHTENFHYANGGVPDAEINGGTVVRHGQLELFNDFALGQDLGGGFGQTVVELGDKMKSLGSVNLATTGTLLDDCSEFSNGIWTDVKGTVDGVSATVGMRILVKDEHTNPERNGVYVVQSIDPTTGRMTLVRDASFNESSEMLYGSQVVVSNGSTQSGLAWFQASQDVTDVNATGTDPVLWERDIVDANIALMIGAANMTIANSIDVNDTNGLGKTTIGGSFATGSSTYTGNITLQEQPSSGSPTVDNVKTVTLKSSSSGLNGSGGAGTVFEGELIESTNTALSIQVEGPGVVTVNGANSYSGTTTVLNQAHLQVGSGGLSGSEANGTTGAGALLVLNGGTVSGTGRIGGTGAVGTGPIANFTKHQINGFLRPGDDAGSGVGTLSVTGSLSLNHGTSSIFQVGDGATGNARIDNGWSNSYFTIGTANYNTMKNYVSTTYGTGDVGDRHDHLDITGSLSMNDTNFFTLQANGYVFQLGDVFNLLDWTTNQANMAGTGIGGNAPIFDLPSLAAINSQYTWDTSLFMTHGIVMVVVPEPAKGLLLACGATLLLLPRRKKRK